MLELNPTPDAPAGDLIKDSTEATFMADVVEASREVPIIVDFWAPWCGPCKTLGPALEAAVTKARGKVRMVKVNVDENQAIAAQLRIQSIPTVYAFWQGQPVDGFQGAVPGSEIDAFIDRISGLAGDGGLGEALEAAEAMLAEGAAADAAQTFAAILGEEPENAAAFGGLVRAQLAAGQVDQAEALLGNVPDAIADAPEIEAVRAQIDLARQAEQAGRWQSYDPRLRGTLTITRRALSWRRPFMPRVMLPRPWTSFLSFFRRDREWNDGAAKAQLFTIFEALKPQDPVALNGRRKLSSMIFA